MLKLERDKAFIQDLRSKDERLRKLRLQSVNVNKAKKSVHYVFICDKAIDDDLKNVIDDKINAITPDCFVQVTSEVKKVVGDKDTVRNAIKEIINRNHVSLAHFVEKEDIYVTVNDGFVNYSLAVIGVMADYISKNKVIESITAKLSNQFCETFIGTVDLKEGGLDVTALQDDEVFEMPEMATTRKIKVQNVQPIDDITCPDTADYIADSTIAGAMMLCGEITDIRQKQTKTGKTFYIIDFNDKTSQASGLYFTHKNTAEKIAQLKVGDHIIASCTQDYYNDKLSLKLDKINRCELPSNFVMERMKKKQIPHKYNLVQPKDNTTVREVNFFTMNDVLPECLMQGDFVTFDLETTGTAVGNDKITEIGATRIKNGVIVQTFQTLINPEKGISKEITDLTGITNEMVKDAPLFEDVIADFYKFCGDSTLIGHNIKNFDIRMLRAQADQLGYYFEQPLIDTWPLAMEVVKGLANYKLNTIAAHFNIKFQHHRALSDAYATAEMFIELIKLKKSLPPV